MKKLYLFFLLPFFGLNAQIEGMWRLAPAAGSLGVGPAQGDITWWANSAGDVITRACLFDDSIKFEANGTMTHYMDNNTWLEAWQGASQDGCGIPVNPHSGGTFTYSYNAGALTINGIGGHIGLPKAYNGGELAVGSPVPTSRTYQISLSSNLDTMTADIQVGAAAWWRFIYVKTNVATVPNPNITFKVNMSNYTGTISNGVYVFGSFNGWCGTCNPLTDMGNGLWQVTLPIPIGSIDYKFKVNNTEENFIGTESCLDPVVDQYFNRYYVITGDATLPAVCFESCDACQSAPPAELIGTWKLRGTAGSLAVGPALGDGSWWSNSLADVTTRACLFDDSIKFEANGTMTHFMDGNTWLEAWQGASQDGCGAPVAPHNGGTFNYSYSAGELTINGQGGHIGLPKAYNGGELAAGSPVPTSRTYLITFSNDGDTLTADISFNTGWWRFVYVKTQIVQPSTPLVTFKVDMNNYTGPAFTTVYVSGNFNNWSGTSNPMSDANSDGIWDATLPISSGPIQYKFTLDGWNSQELFNGGETCTITFIDVDTFVNRFYNVTGDVIFDTVCYESCSACVAGINEQTGATLKLMPNPAHSSFNIVSSELISSVELVDLSGKTVRKVTGSTTEMNITVADLVQGIYTVVVRSENGTTTSRVIVD